jgi:hypothetical protein
MKLDITERPRMSDLRAQTKQLFRRACEDLAVTFTAIGRELDDPKGKYVQRWADEQSDHPLPVWALTSRDAVSDALFERIVADVRDLRAKQSRSLSATTVGLGLAFMRAAGEAIAEIASASADGAHDAHERPAMRERVSAAIGVGQRLVAALHDDEATEADRISGTFPRRGVTWRRL